MSKTVSGLILLAGPILAVIGAGISQRANNAPSTPDTDTYYAVVNGVGMLIILIGLGMFFFGAMRFSRGK